MLEFFSDVAGFMPEFTATDRALLTRVTARGVAEKFGFE
jgi:hypothetical protein